MSFANKIERKDWVELAIGQNFQKQTFLTCVSQKQKVLFMCMPQTQVNSEPCQTSKMELLVADYGTFSRKKLYANVRPGS